MARGRRLAAIMFTDMVGYTALAQADESLAIQVLERHNRLLRPIFPNYRGREIKAIGDSFLVEFESALDATNCATEIQQFLHDYNSSSADAWKIRLRIGIHLGDVIHQENDVFGDAVNIASRIEPLAAPEGVCVTQQVFDQVHNKIPDRIERMATPVLKNVLSPIDVYRIVPRWEHYPEEPQPLTVEPHKRLAVLPFANLSPEPQDEVFAEGLTEEMISELSKVPDLRVIARTSVMRFRSGTKGVSEIGKELNVESVLEGSVRKAGRRIRVSAQLIDARTEEHLWSSAFDRELIDIFAIQNEIARNVAGALYLRSAPPPRAPRQPTRDLDAYALYLQGRSFWNKRSPDAVRAALGFFERARDADPKYARAYSGIADCYSLLVDRVVIPWKEARSKMTAAAREAVLLDDYLADAHASLALTLYWEYDWKNTEQELRRAIELNPNYASAHQWLYQMLTALGRIEQGAQALERAEESDPLSPVILRYAGYSRWVQGRDDEALERWNHAEQLEGEPEWVAADKACFYLKKSMRSDALDWLRRYEQLTAAKPSRAVWLGYLYAALGLRADAENRLKVLLSESERTFVPFTSIAWTYAGLNDAESFFHWMTRATDQRTIDPHILVTFPLIDNLRTDPMWGGLLRRCNVVV